MQKAVDIKHLSKTYKGNIKALCDVNLSVEQGDFFALLGPNGAGKSTLIGILSGLIKPDQGDIQIFGHTLPANHLIGVMQQEFNFNIFETLEQVVTNYAGFFGFPLSQAKERAQYALEMVGLWERRKSRGISLSGGMKRRLMIARSLVHNPKLVVLDEPTAGVDLEIRKSMWEVFKKINDDGTTVILTTHYLEEAENLCKNVAIIDQGKLVLCDSMKNALKALEKEIFLIGVSGLDSTEPLGAFDCKLLEKNVLEVTTDRKENTNISALMKILVENHVHIEFIQNKSNRLEAFFLSKTK